MNILIVANHFPICSARYAADAFTRLGHDVRHVGPAMGREVWGLSLPADYVWESDNHQWASEHPDWATDLIIVMDSDPALLDGQRPNPQFKTPMVIWGVDNHVRDYRRPYFDHYFLAHRHVSMMAWPVTEAEIGPIPDGLRVKTIIERNPDMTHLPCAYDPQWHTPSPIAWADREYDVCMVGVMYPQRRQAVQKLREAGLKVFAGSGLVYESYRDAYHNSRVSLCMSACGDLAQRVFETAAMGCCVLTDPLADLSNEATNKALGLNSFAVYTSEDEMVAQALELALEPIGEVGARILQDCVQSHTWDARAQVIVDWFEGREDD